MWSDHLQLLSHSNAQRTDSVTATHHNDRLNHATLEHHSMNSPRTHNDLVKAGMLSPYVLWDSDSDYVVRKFRTLRL